jgi:hypothetical protein
VSIQSTKLNTAQTCLVTGRGDWYRGLLLFNLISAEEASTSMTSGDLPVGSLSDGTMLFRLSSSKNHHVATSMYMYSLQLKVSLALVRNVDEYHFPLDSRFHDSMDMDRAETLRQSVVVVEKVH